MLGLILNLRRTHWFNVRGERWLGWQEVLAREAELPGGNMKISTGLNSSGRRVEGVEVSGEDVTPSSPPQPAVCLLFISGCVLAVVAYYGWRG